jgi:Mannosylglycerate hydrolase MGH1-like glycoside hydrolase domain
VSVAALYDAPPAGRTSSASRLRIADVTMFYGERSGGIRTYLKAKAAFAARSGAYEHHLIVPETATRQRSLRLAASNGYGRDGRPAPRPRCWSAAMTSTPGCSTTWPAAASGRCGGAGGGPSWMNTAWLLLPAVAELGYAADADRILRSLQSAVERHGYREYYNPLTGRGPGARGFGFSTLLVDLLAQSGNPDPEPSAGRPMMQP